MPQYLSPIQMNKNAIKGVVIDPLAAAPSAPAVGQVYWDTALVRLQIYTGSAWGHTSDNSISLNGQNAAFYLARANHTGTQTSATISDLTATITATKLSAFAAPIADVAMGGFKLTGLADPATAQDAATMGWVQTQVANAAAGIDVKASVRFRTIGNDTLSGLAARDGVTPVGGDRVLVPAQTTGSANGVYIAAAGAWARATDADATGEITPGAFWYIEEGTTWGKTQWRVENVGAIVVGTTSITINQFGGGASYTASLGVQLVGNDFRAQVIASKGILASATGLELDTTIAARKFSGAYGNGALVSIPVVHNLGTKDVSVTTRLVSTDEMLIVDWVATDANTVTLTFAVAPAATSIRVTVVG